MDLNLAPSFLLVWASFLTSHCLLTYKMRIIPAYCIVGELNDTLYVKYLSPFLRVKSYSNMIEMIFNNIRES